MCLLCIEIQKQNMTPKEIARAYLEIAVEDPHLPEILATLADAEDNLFEKVGEALREVYKERD